MLLSRFEVADDEAGVRLDVFLAQEHPDLTRSHVQKLIRENMVTVNGQPRRASYRLRPGDQISLTVPDPVAPKVLPEPIPLDVYYEDDEVIVVHKPQGMVVHPAVGNCQGTLVNALLYHCPNLSGINGVLRPGIVHRLDKDTAGLLMVAKTDRAHLWLAAQLREHKVRRAYTSLVYGNVRQDHGTISLPIGRHPVERKKMAVTLHRGKPAVTHFRVLRRYGNYTLLQLHLETGRTHQIRVHLAYLGHPVVGDLKYGRARPHLGLAGQFLHAHTLGFLHPGGFWLEFHAPLPPPFGRVLEELAQTASTV